MNTPIGAQNAANPFLFPKKEKALKIGLKERKLKPNNWKSIQFFIKFFVIHIIHLMI
jgi:hypothetical protein